MLFCFSFDRRSAALAPSLLCRPAAEPTAVPPAAAPTDIGPSISSASASASASVVTAPEAAAAVDATEPAAADDSDDEMNSVAADELVSEDPRLSHIRPLREWVRDHFPRYRDANTLGDDFLFLVAVLDDYQEAHDAAMGLEPQG